MGQLGEKHCGQMAAHAEAYRLGIHSGLQGDSCDHPLRNELAKLVENDIIGSGWRFTFAHNPTEWQGIKPDASPTFPFCQKILWDACEYEYQIYSQ